MTKELEATTAILTEAWINTFNDTESDLYIDYANTSPDTLFQAMAYASAIVAQRCFGLASDDVADVHFKMIKHIYQSRESMRETDVME